MRFPTLGGWWVPDWGGGGVASWFRVDTEGLEGVAEAGGQQLAGWGGRSGGVGAG